MANYFLSKKAVEDLSNIWNYTFDTWSEKQADKYYALLLEAIAELAAAKSYGKPYPEIGEEIYGARVLQHIIFYRNAKGNSLEVIRILHTRMDLKSRMSD